MSRPDLEDARDRMAADPEISRVAGAIALSQQHNIPCVILVSEDDAATWREYTWHLKGVEIVATATLAAGQARVKA